MAHDMQEINAAAEQLKLAMDSFCQSHPIANRIKLAESLMPKLLGTAPSWAQAQHPPYGWTISLGDVLNAGVFCVYYGKDPDTGELIALVQRRKEPLNESEYRIGAVGGYADPSEKLHEAISRETREEVCNERGEPIFTPKFYKYAPLFNDVDTRGNPPILFQAFCYELSSDEITAIKNHTKKLNDEPDYKEGVFKATHKEVTGLEFMPLEEIVSPQKRPLFTYPRQHDAYIATQRLLQKGQHITSYFEQDPAMQGYVTAR